MSATPGRRIVRYTVTERLVHWTAGGTFVYLLLSGLAFWTPGLYWLSTLLGGGYLTRVLHPWVGLVFTVAVVWMWAIWRRDMRVGEEDRAWRRAMGHYIRNEDDRVPAAGRFNYGQKLLFWVMVWGALALLLSGLGLWFTVAIPWEMQWLRLAAILVHAVAALVTIGAFIVHVYMGVAVVPGGLDAIVSGEVSEQWARHHHAGWLSRVTGHGPSRD